MKKVIRTSVIAASLGLVLSIAGAGEARSQNGTLREIETRMDSYNKALTSLQADITMVKTNSQLNISETSSGQSSYISKNNPRTKGMNYIRINWIRPVEEQIIVIGDRYQLYRPRLNQVVEGRTDSAKNNASVGGALSFMSMSRHQLKANYEVALLSPDPEDLAGTKVWHLQLTPRTKASYKEAELWMDANGAPLQAKITEKNGDTTEVRLSNRKENANINTALFVPNYPKGVKKTPS